MVYNPVRGQHRGNLKSEAGIKPNVVLILIDDLSYFGVSAYGSHTLKSRFNYFPQQAYSTPRIDEIAKEGVRCDHAFVHPICENTRVALMTGQHNGRNFMAPKALHSSQITFSDVFKDAGYATGMYGKWKQTRGTPSVPGVRYISEFGWDDYACFDVVYEQQRYINPTLVINDVSVNYQGKTTNDPRTGRRYYGPDIFNYRALDFIEAHKNEPFFLYYPMVLIHDEHKPTPDTQPESIFNTVSESASVDLREYAPDMLYYMDKLIGNVVDKIDSLGIRENTMIIILGDNGNKEFFQYVMEDGRTLAGGKGHTRFHGEQVPFIVSWPGTVMQDTNYTGIIDVTDVYPTIFDACGIDIPNPERIDGISIMPQLRGDTPEPHRNAIYRWHNGNNVITDRTWLLQYAQTPEFKYYYPHEIYTQGRFFDLRSDPYERAGVRGTQVGWENYYYSGLNINGLNTEQQEAYLLLKNYVDSMAYVSASSMEITGYSGDTLDPGDTIYLNYEMQPSNAMRNNVVWESSDPAIASVDKFGRFIARGRGEVVITAYSWDGARPVANNRNPEYYTTGVKDQIRIGIQIVPVTGIGFLSDSLDLKHYSSSQLNVQVQPDSATNQTIFWSSGNPDVASVSESGVIKGIYPGSCIVYAESENGGLRDSIFVQILKNHVTGISLSHERTSLYVGQSGKIYSSIQPPEASDKSIRWYSSDTSVAVVDSTGTIGAKSEGESKIYVITNDGEFTDTTYLSVIDPYSGVTNPTGRNIKIYPNPAGNFLTIEYETGLIGDADLEIFNLLGKKIRTHQLTQLEKTGQGLARLALDGIIPGIYILEIRFENNIYKARFIKE